MALRLPPAFLGVPTVTVAVAVGMHAVSETPWEVIAGAVSQMGLGTYPAATVEMAVRDFCAAAVDAWERGDVPSPRETADGVRSRSA